jgi:HTH-type transcriptional regulator, competence development regulator
MATPSLGEHIKTLREQAGYSQRQLAAQAGLHHSYLARLESGDNDKPAPDILQRIADVLEIDANELLAFIGIKPSLPEPRVYFRRAYGLSQAEAEEAARLIAERYNKQPKNN